jgi:hypothetical protein
VLLFLLLPRYLSSLMQLSFVFRIAVCGVFAANNCRHALFGFGFGLSARAQEAVPESLNGFA